MRCGGGIYTQGPSSATETGTVRACYCLLLRTFRQGSSDIHLPGVTHFFSIHTRTPNFWILYVLCSRLQFPFHIFLNQPKHYIPCTPRLRRSLPWSRTRPAHKSSIFPAEYAAMGAKRRHEQQDDAGDRSQPTEGAPARKRHQAYTENDAILAKLFADLADDVKTVRINAIREILSTVKDADPDKIDKIFQRLVRGLCSNRKSARLGFVIVLTEVFAIRCQSPLSSQNPEAWFKDTLSVIESCTTPPSNESKQVSRCYLCLW